MNLISTSTDTLKEKPAEPGGWRRWMTPGEVVKDTPDDSATFHVQAWLERLPWHPTAGWVMLGALLAVGWPQLPAPLAWSSFVLLFLLVDPFWGAIWRLANGRRDLLPLHNRTVHPVNLPYLQPESPAAELLGRNTSGALPVLFRVAGPTLLLTGLLASTLGQPAFILTAVLLLVTIFGWISTRRRHGEPRAGVSLLLHGIVTVVLPWLLTIQVAGATPASPKWPLYLGFMLLWLIQQWGENRSIRFRRDHLGLIAVVAADIGVAALLIALRSPLWLAFWLILTLPAWLGILTNGAPGRATGWRLLGMLAATVALGQGVW